MAHNPFPLRNELELIFDHLLRNHLSRSAEMLSVQRERSLPRKAALSPLQFRTTGFDIVGEKQVLKEERFDKFKAGLYYPTNIGDVYDSRYQVLGKLGFGTTSTVWLARNLQ